MIIDAKNTWTLTVQNMLWFRPSMSFSWNVEGSDKNTL